jgi:hypothetical protein
MRSTESLPARFGGLMLAAVLGIGMPAALRAQTGGPKGPEPPDARVAVLPASLYNDQANVREASDSAKSGIATAALRERLTELLGPQLAPFGAVDSIAASPAAVALAGGPLCNAEVACARWAARHVGARWVVMAKVSKTSNLIWLLSAQLIRVENGEIILDDSTELKGEPAAMVRLGARIFAERVARTVRSGGYTTNFPQEGAGR